MILTHAAAYRSLSDLDFISVSVDKQQVKKLPPLSQPRTLPGCASGVVWVIDNSADADSYCIFDDFDHAIHL